MAIELGFTQEEGSSLDRFIKIPAVIWERLEGYEKELKQSPEQFIMDAIRFKEKEMFGLDREWTDIQ